MFFFTAVWGPSYKKRLSGRSTVQMVSDLIGVSVAVGDGGTSVALLSTGGVMVLVFTGFKPWQADNNKIPKRKNKSTRFMMFANLTGGY
jgi:hypothetical protein